MLRNSKTFGMAILSLFAVALLTGPSASAQLEEFESEQGVETITGTTIGEAEFSVTEEDVEVFCEGKFKNATGTAAPAMSELYLTPEYENCFSGLGGVEVNINGCHYRFYTVLTIESKRTGLFAIMCPTGKVMDFRITLFGTLKCTVTLPPQVGRAHIVLDNENPGVATERDIKATVDVSKLKYEEQTGTGLKACPNGPTEGTLQETVTLKALTHEGNKKGLWID